jgi:hypothetical protein
LLEHCCDSPNLLSDSGPPTPPPALQSGTASGSNTTIAARADTVVSASG